MNRLYMRHFSMRESFFLFQYFSPFFLQSSRLCASCVYKTLIQKCSNAQCVYIFVPTILSASTQRVHFHTQNCFSLFSFVEKRSRVVCDRKPRKKKKSKSLPNNFIFYIIFLWCAELSVKYTHFINLTLWS